MATYPMHVAGLDRDFPICKVTDDLYIGAFIMFGDAELTVRCAEELLKLAEGIDYDYLFTAEAKSIPLIHEMARQSGAKKYFIARKGPKVYMPDPISVEDKSITTVAQQKLFLGSDDADLIRGKKILLVDDVISTGGSLKAMEALVEKAGGVVLKIKGYACGKEHGTEDSYGLGILVLDYRHHERQAGCQQEYADNRVVELAEV
mgnify:CR=1 FL=1